MAKLINRIGSLWSSFIYPLIFVTIISGCATVGTQPPRVTSRDVLWEEESEDHGYGLYSYILLSRKALNRNEFNRYLRLFDAFLKSLNPSKNYLKRKLYKMDEINVTYWLMLRRKYPGGKVSENLEFFVNNYDYPRSRLILNRIKGLNGPGPFIVSYNTPLGVPNKELRVRRRQMLIFDLSDVHQDLFGDVLSLYQDRVAEGPETWKETFDIEKIRITFRSVLKEQADNVIYLVTFLKDYLG